MTPNASGPAAADTGERINGLRAAFMASLARGDASAVADFYADEARLVVPETRPIDGRSAIEAFWRAGVESGMSELDLKPGPVTEEGDFVCEVGSYVLRAQPRDERAVIDHGRYLIVLRRDRDGSWRRAFELFAPVQGPADATLGP
jgi:uncharacterized protein (TIGR02246 family)